MLIVTATLSGVVWLTQGLRFVDMIVNTGLSVLGFLSLTLLLLPTALAYILPIALFCAILFTYHRLNADRELVVMRSAGLSAGALAAPALILAGIVTVILYSFTLYLMPAGYRAFKGLQFTIRHDYGSVLLREGVFNTLIDGLTVYVRERKSGGELLGILVHDNRNPERPVTMMAERGALVQSEDGPRFLLMGGNRHEVDADRGELSMLYFDTYALDLGLFAIAPEDRWRKASERYFHELWFPEGSQEAIERYGRDFAPEAHRRLVLPLHAFAFALIALAAILSGEFDRRGQWRRITAGAVIALVVQALGVVFTSMAAEIRAFIPMMYLNVAVAIAGSIYVLGATRRRRVFAAAGAVVEENANQ
jgi:lipopolysaccharide export system permease protein